MVVGGGKVNDKKIDDEKCDKPWKVDNQKCGDQKLVVAKNTYLINLWLYKSPKIQTIILQC